MDTPTEKETQDDRAEQAIKNFVLEPFSEDFLEEFYLKLRTAIAEELKDFAQDDDTSVWVAAGYDMPTREEELEEMIPDITEQMANAWLLLKQLRASFIPDTIDGFIDEIKKYGSTKVYSDWTGDTMDIADAVRRVLNGERRIQPLSRITTMMRNYNQAKLVSHVFHDPDVYKTGIRVKVFGKAVTVVKATPQNTEQLLGAMPQASRAYYRTIESFAVEARKQGKDVIEITPRQLWLDTLAIPKLSRLDSKTVANIDAAMEWLGTHKIWIDASEEAGRIGEKVFEEQPIVGFRRVLREYKGKSIQAYKINMDELPLFNYSQQFGKHGQNSQIHRAYAVVYDVDDKGNVLDTIAKPSIERADIRDEVISQIIATKRMGKEDGIISLAKLAERTGVRYDNKDTRAALRKYVRIVLCNLQTPIANGKALIESFAEVKRNNAVTGYKIFLPNTKDKQAISS